MAEEQALDHASHLLDASMHLLTLAQVDKDGTTRDAVREGIAARDPMFEALLTGARWVGGLLRYFYWRLETAKYEMERRPNGPYQ